jgi:hypothetical protein
VAEVVADASKFCRRIANRLDADAIEADISGDVDTAIGTLTAIAGLALD